MKKVIRLIKDIKHVSLAVQKVSEIKSNLVKHGDIIKDVQEKHIEGVSGVKSTLSLIATLFKSQAVAVTILQKSITGLNWGFQIGMDHTGSTLKIQICLLWEKLQKIPNH